MLWNRQGRAKPWCQSVGQPLLRWKGEWKYVAKGTGVDMKGLPMEAAKKMKS